MSMKTFNLPDLGEGLQDAEIVSWHVSVGDHVVTDQPLVSVETDKAVVEVPSPHSGRIFKLCGDAGDRIEVGAPLVEFEEKAAADTGTVVGEIKNDADAIGHSATVAARESFKVKAMPAVRALAHKLGVDLSLVQPTGSKGLVTKQDVERAASTLDQAGPLEKLRGVRRAMAERMAMAHAEVVPATVTDEADVGSWPGKTNATIRLAGAIAAACRAVPALNAWYDGHEKGRRLHSNVDLGIAVNTANGLFVPVLRDVGNRDPASLSEGLDRLKADIAARSIPAKELRGQTISLSNFGMLGGRYASLVVVPPQVAIVGAGRIEPRVVAAAGKAVVRNILPLSLTFDHRAVTGAEAASFMAALIQDLAKKT